VGIISFAVSGQLILSSAIERATVLSGAAMIGNADWDNCNNDAAAFVLQILARLNRAFV
jgi:hypothetical protein